MVREVLEDPPSEPAPPELVADVHPLDLAVRLALVGHEQDAAAARRPAVGPEHEEVDALVDELPDAEPVAALRRVAGGEVVLELEDQRLGVGRVGTLLRDDDGHRGRAAVSDR